MRSSDSIWEGRVRGLLFRGPSSPFSRSRRGISLWRTALGSVCFSDYDADVSFQPNSTFSPDFCQLEKQLGWIDWRKWCAHSACHA